LKETGCRGGGCTVLACVDASAVFDRGKSGSSSVEELCWDGEGYEKGDRVKCVLG